jgi:segregation and condensation protein B
MSRRSRSADDLDLELDDLPPAARWRAWMSRIEAVIFASAAPVSRESLARLVGRAANLQALIADIQDELRERPYELVAVAGGWAFRTRAQYAPAIRAAGARESLDLS